MKEILWNMLDYALPIFLIVLMLFVVILIIMFVRWFW